MDLGEVKFFYLYIYILKFGYYIAPTNIINFWIITFSLDNFINSNHTPNFTNQPKLLEIYKEELPAW